MMKTGKECAKTGKMSDIHPLRRRPVRGLIRARRIEGGLHPRIIGRAEEVPGQGSLALLLEKGSGTLDNGLTPLGLTGPGALWCPWVPGARLMIAPGSAGVYVILDATALDRVLGAGEASDGLRDMASQTVRVDTAASSREFARLFHAFGELLNTVADRSLSGRMQSETYLRLILLELARRQDLTLVPARHNASSRQIFERFKSFVEAHFRERPTVERVAEVLAVSSDRLTDICQREHQTTPKRLISKRLMIEAASLLENSALPVEHISEQLGFSSASQFSRFFQTQMGQPPGRFRRQRSAVTVAPGNLYEWP